MCVLDVAFWLFKDCPCDSASMIRCVTTIYALILLTVVTTGKNIRQLAPK